MNSTHAPRSFAPPKGQEAPGRPFQRMSLARQFLMASALVLLAGVAATGTWVGRQIETSVVNRTAHMAAVYFESIVAGRLDELIEQGSLGEPTRRMLDEIFVNGPLAQKVVRFKLWTPDGRIHYSSHHAQEQQVFPLHDHHAYALAGTMHAAISNLDGPDNAAERAQWSRLIEIYVPLRQRDGGAVRAVAEFYHSMENIDADVLAAQRQSWIAITSGALLLYTFLYAMVHRASSTITGQQTDLERQLDRMQRVLVDNRRMHLRLQQAGEETASMTERSLRRIAADLHDGPAQDLAFALLSLDELHDAPAMAPPAGTPVHRLREALQRAMLSLRHIADGLIVPGVRQMSLDEVLQRAALDFTRKTGVPIETRLQGPLGEAAEAVKITAYRVVQEALNNNFRHARGYPARVLARAESGKLVLEIQDDGPGFDVQAPVETGHFGLAFQRERVMLLSGTIDIRSAPGQGVVVCMQLPLQPQGGADG